MHSVNGRKASERGKGLSDAAFGRGIEHFSQLLPICHIMEEKLFQIAIIIESVSVHNTNIRIYKTFYHFRRPDSFTRSDRERTGRSFP